MTEPLHFRIHSFGKTGSHATEERRSWQGVLISAVPNMGLTSWTGVGPRPSEIEIAKNCLKKDDTGVQPGDQQVCGGIRLTLNKGILRR